MGETKVRFARMSNPLLMDESYIITEYIMGHKIDLALSKPMMVLEIEIFYKHIGHYKKYFFNLDQKTFCARNISIVVQELSQLLLDVDRSSVVLNIDYERLFNSNQEDDKTNISLVYSHERGPLNYHFGHFITSTLPEISLLEQFQKKGHIPVTWRYLCYPPQTWEKELESLYNINSSIKKTVDSSREYFVENSNNSIDIKISKRSIVFFKFSNLSLSIPSRQGYKVDRWCNANHKTNKIVVLSRRKLLGRPKRWINEEMCINNISADCVVIDPQEMTPKSLFALISKINPLLLIGTAGSALHQFFVVRNIPFPICMVIGESNTDINKNIMIKSDFGYCIDRLNIIGKVSQKDVPMNWDKPFTINESDFTTAIDALVNSKSNHQERCISVFNSVYLSRV